ncbi:MAG: hypothetical protein GF398_06110 [Chitinivibrionales bacterium]|nr:hypothetical protein [Chitinivibrionales bacterium]
MRIITLSVLILAIAACTPPPGEERPELVKSKETSKSVEVHQTSFAQKEFVESLPIGEWTGEQFVLLGKPRMFQKHGYLLYDSPALSEATHQADPQIAHPNHRLKYDRFEWHIVAVKSVTAQQDGEFLVAFFDDSLGREIYAKSRKHVIEGIARLSDLDGAGQRWADATIYCRLRHITTFDETASRYGTIPVSITEPLQVTEVRWGLSPLPPKPIWLVVVRQNGDTGFIPVNYSWTNILYEMRTEGLPWEKDIFEEDPRELFAWDDLYWQAIDEKKLLTHMTTQQVQMSWGKPTKATVEETETGTITTYKYLGNKLVFKNDTLVETYP